MGSAFEWVANHPALDFVNTVSWGREGLDQERLGSYGDVLQWSREAKTVPDAVVERLERQAAGNPRAAKQAFESARELRALLQEVFGEIARGRPRSPAGVARFNAFLRRLFPTSA